MSSNTDRAMHDDPDAEKERMSIAKALKRLRNSGREKSATSKDVPSIIKDKPSSLSTDVPDPSSANIITSPLFPYRFVPLRMKGLAHDATEASAFLLDEIGGVEGLKLITERFYELAFADETLDKFIHSHDDPHGHRFATWIHQKLGGPGELWSHDRAARPKTAVRTAGGGRVVVRDRSSAHVAAWHSAKRPKREVGRHFQLDECRVWMRLHFLALRESGLLDLSPSFCDYYVRFIGHFVAVYEQAAPVFARESFRWSEDPANVDRYIANGRVMSDVLGLSVGKQLTRIPQSEAEDAKWPYIDEHDIRE